MQEATAIPPWESTMWEKKESPDPQSSVTHPVTPPHPRKTSLPEDGSVCRHGLKENVPRRNVPPAQSTLKVQKRQRAGG